MHLNPYQPEFSDPQNPENARPHSGNSIENYNPITVNPAVKM